MSSIPILASIHPADLYRDPKMRLAAQSDWVKVKRLLAGEWPLPIPERTILSTSTTPDCDAVWDWMQSVTTPVVIDTEYNRETRYLTLLGACARNTGGDVTGFQVEWPRLPVWLKMAFSVEFKKMLARVPMVSQNSIGAEIPTLQKNLGVIYEDYFAIEDTMLMHAVLYSEWPHDLEFLASIYSDYPKQKHLARENLLDYNWGDCLDTLCVFEKLLGEFERERV